MTDFKEGDKLSHGYNFISNEMKKGYEGLQVGKVDFTCRTPWFRHDCFGRRDGGISGE